MSQKNDIGKGTVVKNISDLDIELWLYCVYGGSTQMDCVEHMQLGIDLQLVHQGGLFCGAGAGDCGPVSFIYHVCSP